MLVSFGFSRSRDQIPFVGASDDSYGFNPSTGTFYHSCQPVYSASLYSLGDDQLLEFDVFVDVMVGYFWVVNKRGEVLSPVVTSLGQAPLFFGVVFSSRSVSQVVIESVVPRLPLQDVVIKGKDCSSPVESSESVDLPSPTDCSQSHDQTSLMLITSHLNNLLFQEISFYTSHLLSPSSEGETEVRLFGKRPIYIITYYCMLSLVNIALNAHLPLPMTLVKSVSDDLSVRKRIMDCYPSLFAEDTGSLITVATL